MVAESAPIKLTLNTESEHIVFRVHNEGAPIPESALQTIFDLTPRRRKEDEKPEKKFSHLGIGLFVVKKIVEAHSGNGERKLHGSRRDHFRSEYS